MLNPADTEFAATLVRSVPGLRLRAAEARYLEEPRGRYHGGAALVALPETVDEVAGVIRTAAAARVGVVPYGGGTGLVGGQVWPGAVPLVLSLERMTAVRALDPVGNVMVVEAGAILADVQMAAGSVGRMFPLGLASQGSARIGGCLATNAGGVNVLRYGSTRDLCLGVEAVLGDGTILRGLKRLRKDNTGYDLRNLLIGSEGSLGVITAASLRMFEPPARVGTVMMTIRDPAAALSLLALAEARMAGCISAFELISGQGLAFLEEVLPDLRQPFEPRPDWAVLIEIGVPAAMDPEVALADLFDAGLSSGLAHDAVIAQNELQRAAFWAVRESLPIANRRIGAVSSHDISVPLAKLPEFIAAASAAVAALGSFRVNCFGHVGDGNLHYNVFPVPGQGRGDDALRAAVKATVHGVVDEFGGSVSAEHGIGRLKVDDLEQFGDPGKLAAMRAIKAALDPAGIMNPGAVLRYV
ncbi:FAD-binding oxidoreductase [Phaeovulum sp.]|uniref:FAD-binding oxidoreductase n=1 Tax=Phaeovulum sp. TaxID=2934796 RepID=UPI0039E6441D